MSNHLAIATATVTLARILTRAAAVVPNGKVTFERPDVPQTGSPPPAVNIYLYQVTPNSSLRNEDLPARSNNGKVVKRRKAAWDLHYLLTFFGKDGELEPQRMLGAVLRTLHSRPVLARDDIAEVVAAADPTEPDEPEHPYLKGSDLHQQIELIKFSPTLFNLEELSKLWSVFFQTPYALSVAYQGTVVLIDGEEAPEPALPVREPRVRALPLQVPVIEEVTSSAGPRQPIVAGSELVVRGSRLSGEDTRMRLGAGEVAPETVTDRELRVTLSAPPLPDDSLRAGLQPVQVVHRVALGSPPVPHTGLESNPAPLVLSPSIESLAVENVVGSGDEPRSADVRLTVVPDIAQGQRLALQLIQNIGGAPAAYTFFAKPPQSQTGTVTFAVKNVAAADYLVRVQVDGAASPLEVNPDPNDPRYIGPTITIP